MDVGMGTVSHDGDVSYLVQMVIDIHSKVMEVRHRGNMVGA